jgi:hypothetical protein
MNKTISGLMIFVLFLTSGVLFLMWRSTQDMSDLQRRAIECSSFVNTGVDLTGKGKNNCTSPELIPKR